MYIINRFTERSMYGSEKTISFAQKKTKKHLTLPLQDDVGWAIIDYLKNGRPISDSKYVFIQHKPPYGQYTDLRNVLVKQMRKAGIETPANKRIRMHCFRHPFICHRLNTWAHEKADLMTLLPILSKYVGHTGVPSTQWYFKLTAEAFPDVLEAME